MEESPHEAPRTKEEIRALFSEERLATLSLEEYATLLQGFPGEMVAHTMRQGIRDHVGMVDHTAGEGDYFDGFMKIVEDGRLRPPMGVILKQEAREQNMLATLRQLIDLDEQQSEEDAISSLDYFLKKKYPGGYDDRMAVHFSAEAVADDLYGSERGNEIFIAYPAMHIASQYYFNQPLRLEEHKGDHLRNDIWVWANEERGLNIQAGIVFLPADARVSPETGSRYELGKDNIPIINERRVMEMLALLNRADTEAVLSEIDNAIEKHQRNDGSLPSEIEHELRKIVEDRLGVHDIQTQSVLLDLRNISDLRLVKLATDERKREIVQTVLTKEQALYETPTETISSQDFWEQYFSGHGNRPSKIVYYHGNNPTTALRQFQETYGLQTGTASADMGFLERRVQGGSAQAMAGSEEFRSVAVQTIKKYFAEKERE